MIALKWKLLFTLNSFYIVFASNCIYCQDNIIWDIFAEKTNIHQYKIIFSAKLEKNFKVAAIEEEMIGLTLENLKKQNISLNGKTTDNYDFNKRPANGAFANYYIDSFKIIQNINITPKNKESTKLISKVTYLLINNNDNISDPPFQTTHFAIIWKEEQPTIFVGYKNLNIKRINY